MPLKVFVSCSSNWPQLNDFRELLTTLGYEPIIVEKKESLGKDPDDKSHHYMKQCDKIVFVITADAVDKNGKFHPTSNVAIEIGWSNDLFKDKDKIYVLVDNARQPSMLNKTYIHFSEGNYIVAITELIKNLNAQIGGKTISKKSPKLSRLDIFCLLAIADTPFGTMARPELLTAVCKQFDISHYKFNLTINRLVKHRLITPGIIASGHNHSGDYYYKISSGGMDILDNLEDGPEKERPGNIED